MKIEDNFAHWIKTAAGVGNISAEKYESRIAAINELANDIKTNEALDLLRIYCKIPPKDADYFAKFVKPFQDRDPSFDLRDNPFIFQVLAAITLIQVLSNEPSNAADAVGLALLTYTFDSYKRVLPDEAVSIDLETAARNYLSTEASRVRKVGKSNKIEIEFDETSLNLSTLKTTADQAGIFTPAMALKLFNSVDEILTTSKEEQEALVDALNKELDSLWVALRVNAEETNIFWWLFSEWSSELEKPYRDLTISQACLLAGKELADLTSFVPGHKSALGFLARITKLTKARTNVSAEGQRQDSKLNITIKGAVNNIPEEWNKDWLRSAEVESVRDFCILHSAFLNRLELGGDKWCRLFEKQSGIKASTLFPAYIISNQFFQERLLVRAHT